MILAERGGAWLEEQLSVHVKRLVSSCDRLYLVYVKPLTSNICSVHSPQLELPRRPGLEVPALMVRRWMDRSRWTTQNLLKQVRSAESS